MRIGNHTFEWRHFQWPWMIPNPDFNVTPLFWCWRSEKRYKIQTYENGLAHSSLMAVISNYLKWPWNSDTKHASRGLSATVELLVVLVMWSRRSLVHNDGVIPEALLIYSVDIHIHSCSQPTGKHTRSKTIPCRLYHWARWLLASKIYLRSIFHFSVEISPVTELT